VEKSQNCQLLVWCTRLGVLFFGAYLFYGAHFTWIHKKWPAFMPPQLDLMGLLLESLSTEFGVYLNVAFLSILGLFFVSLALLPLKKKRW
jgi:hypothetical protein